MNRTEFNALAQGSRRTACKSGVIRSAALHLKLVQILLEWRRRQQDAYTEPHPGLAPFIQARPQGSADCN